MNIYLSLLDEKAGSKVLLQQQITILTNTSDTPLSQEQLVLLNIVERILVEKDESIKTILSQRMTKILENSPTEITLSTQKPPISPPKKQPLLNKYPQLNKKYHL